MTQKELLYMEDAIGHEKSIIKILEESIKMVEDDNLVSFLNQELEEHITRRDNLINVLEGIANE